MHAMPPSPDVRSGSPRSESLVGIAILGPIAAIAVLAPLVVLALVSTKFMEIFRDFGVALPLITPPMLKLGVVLVSPLGVLVLLMIAAATVAVVSLGWRVHKAMGLALFLLCMGWLMLSSVLLVVGLMMPLLSMIESLKQSAAA